MFAIKFWLFCVCFKSPSIYSENRKRALKYSIEKIEQNHNGEGGEGLNYSIFGDFNFRLDLASLIGDFSRKSESVETKDKNNKLSRLVYKETGSHDKEIFVIEEKKFKWDLGQAIQGMKNEVNRLHIKAKKSKWYLYTILLYSSC